MAAQSFCAAARVASERFLKNALRHAEISLPDSFEGVLEAKQITCGCQFQNPNSSRYDETSFLGDAPSLSVVSEQEIRLEFQRQADGLGFAEIVKLKRWVDVRWGFDG
jgi:hypothetical protein